MIKNIDNPYSNQLATSPAHLGYRSFNDRIKTAKMAGTQIIPPRNLTNVIPPTQKKSKAIQEGFSIRVEWLRDSKSPHKKEKKYITLIEKGGGFPKIDESAQIAKRFIKSPNFKQQNRFQALEEMKRAKSAIPNKKNTSKRSIGSSNTPDFKPENRVQVQDKSPEPSTSNKNRIEEMVFIFYV